MITEKRSGKPVTKIVLNIFYSQPRKGLQGLLYVDVHDHTAQIENDIFYVIHIISLKPKPKA